MSNFFDNIKNNNNDENEGKKFQLTRGMLLLIILVVIIVIVVVALIVSKVKSNNKNTYSENDFILLESRMESEAEMYVEQNEIELTKEPYKIELDKLKSRIGSSKVKAINICDGYVLASMQDEKSFIAYIKCEYDGKKYITEGYRNKDKTTKTTKVKDNEPPVITLQGESEININLGEKYKEPGYSATDNIDGDITSLVKISGSVLENQVGTYNINYSVKDKAGNKANVSRKINVINVITTTTTITTTSKQAHTTTTTRRPTNKPTTTTKKQTIPPTIIIKGNNPLVLNQGDSYVDGGYRAVDALGNDITGSVKITNNVKTNIAGTYYVTYTVTDSYGNTSNATRTVIVKPKSNYIKLQSISLSPNEINLSIGGTKKIEIFFNPSNATNKNVSWASSDNNIATVSSNGVVTARRRGKAIITASGADNKSAAVVVYVK